MLFKIPESFSKQNINKGNSFASMRNTKMSYEFQFINTNSGDKEVFYKKVFGNCI